MLYFSLQSSVPCHVPCHSMYKLHFSTKISFVHKISRLPRAQLNLHYPSFTQGIRTSPRMPVLIQISGADHVFICCVTEIHTPRLFLPRQPGWIILWAWAGNHRISSYFAWFSIPVLGNNIWEVLWEVT